MVAVRNMKYLFMLYRQQRNNYVARKRRILAAIILKLQKRKQHFLKLLNLIKHMINLLETLPQKRTRRARIFQRNNDNWWTRLSKTSETNYLGRISECPEQHLFCFKQN